MTKKPEFKVQTFNNISPVGLERFDAKFEVGSNVSDPDAIMLRSHRLHDVQLPDSVLAVARAGAGVNNIPLDKMSKRGIVVFNTPGANANAVKELVIAAMFLAARNLPEAVPYVLKLSAEDMPEAVEKGKKQFVGSELFGKTLAVVGLGAIGQRIAEAALHLGMHVVGYDAVLSPENASKLSPQITLVDSLEEAASQCDYLTVHVPLLDSTRGLINASVIEKLRPNTVVLNFSRQEIVDEAAVLGALDDGRLACFVTDFPSPASHNHPKVIALPHLGASTDEAEENCAIMAANELRAFLEFGNIGSSVNFPSVIAPQKGALRLTFAHKNEPGVVAKITSILSDENINVAELHNNNRGDYAYTIADLDASDLPDAVKNQLQSIPQMLKMRVIA